MKHREASAARKLMLRVVLYATPLILAAGLWRLVPSTDEQTFDFDTDWASVDFTEYEAVRLFQSYLQIDTSYPNGNEIKGAEFLAGILEAEGIPVHLERLGSRNANLWAEVPGDDPRALVLHNHIDIEPVGDPEGWRFPPLGGVIDGPFIYGRGAFDMKSVAIAQLKAILEIKRSGKRPARSVIFLATGDEERDSWMGTRRLLREHPEWQQKFWAVLTEGGAVEARALDSARYWGTEFHQKRFADVWVCDSDERRLAELRLELDNRQMPRRMIPPLEEFFAEFGPTRDRPESRELLSQPTLLLERLKSYPRDVDVTVIPPYSNHILSSRVVAFPVQASEEGGFQLRLILHMHSDEEVEDVWEALIGDALDGFTYQVETVHSPILGSPLDHDAWVRLDTFMGERFPEIEHGPLSPPYVATDARFFRQYGIPAYGFSPFHMLAVDAVKMKGADERIPLPPFLDGVDTYEALVQALVH